MRFSHLHVHTQYSLLDGLPKIDELLAKVKALGMDSVAITDHGTMYGVVEFYKKAKAAGVKPIIGVEVYLAPLGRLQKRARIDELRYHLVLLAKNKIGYQNLLKLTTLAHLEGFYYKPRVDWELLEKYHEGLICLTACLKGEIPVLLRSARGNIEPVINRYLNLFGRENFYFELQHHPNLLEQEVVNRKIAELGKKLQIPLVATNDVHYLNSEDNEAQDVLLCLQTKRKKEDKDRLCMLGEDFSLRPPERMITDFKEWPEAIENTQKIVADCNVELDLGKVILPDFPLPEGYTADPYLRELCEQGLKRRFGEEISEQVKQRLEYELGVIEKTGFAPYFLIVQDFVNWAKGQGIVVGPGRGSAAGSIVSYLLNVTNVDPLKYGLLFERFLNPERIAMPDIDLDFTDTRRDEVINYVRQRYGEDHVAQIITFGTMAARAAVRDVGRVLGFPYTICDQLAKLIPAMMNLNTAINNVPELKTIYQEQPNLRRLLDIAKKLEGVARHASTHACGIVMTKENVDSYTARQHASATDQAIVTQYEMHSIEDLGLLKMDFLGLRNLTIIENTIKLLENLRNIKINIDNIPLSDQRTFNLLRKGETTGIFQLESSGMRRYLKELKPAVFEDLVALVALYRPGPIEWIPNYIAGKNGKQAVKYLHPLLKPILEKTYGVAVYQEQVLQIARDLAGFTLGEADILRKAIGKKIPQLLQAQKEKFIQGCAQRGINAQLTAEIFAFMEPFAGYGFNRSHAVCYALIGYQTAYLKANFPVEFMAALMSAEQGDVERAALYIEECQKLGIAVLPPSINESFASFTAIPAGEGGKPTIRFGLAAIKNVGEHIVDVIIQERSANSPYQNLEDFLSRVRDKDLNKKSLESLIQAGALDQFGERNLLLANIERLLTFHHGGRFDSGQTNLFSLTPTLGLAHRLRLEPADPATEKQKLTWEKSLLGLYLSGHPLHSLWSYLENIVVPCQRLSQEKGEKSVRVSGVIIAIKKIITKSSEPMLFVKIEDQSGSTELLVFPGLVKSNPQIWQADKIILASGRLSFKEGAPKVLCSYAAEINSENIENVLQGLHQSHLWNSVQHAPRPVAFYPAAQLNHQQNPEHEPHICIKVPSFILREKVETLRSLFNQYPGPLKVYLMVGGGMDKKIETKFSIIYNTAVQEELEKTIGRNAVVVSETRR